MIGLPGLPIWPKEAGITAALVDHIVLAELMIVVLVLCFVFSLMTLFCIRYRQGSTAPRENAGGKSWRWEIGWTTATLAAFLALFVWGASAYVDLYSPPSGGLELFVVGKQWMWKIQHPGGQREIDEIHLPVGKAVRVVLASEDVIHSFYVPDFRTKHDAVPGQFETFWFEPTEIGSFPLECSEYCGMGHAKMGGSIIVTSDEDYARWLANAGVSQSLTEEGRALFRAHGCSGCHDPGSTVHAPPLAGLYGTFVHLADGRVVRADESYIRDCILEPLTQVVAGYPPVMPSFAGQLGEDDLIALTAYIQSLSQDMPP
jgi:cytochrome c oxidase subunit 2